ncbi:MAG: hypothetical protein J6O49_18745 [Bacteroidaceae bacterium]|nr:hypothetical protein [Bacteroidaceae bacterium]
MKSVGGMNEARIILISAIVFMLIGTLASCTDYIDPSAANSLAAIIAVIGEYLYAALALVLVVVLRILRPAGVALAVLGVLGLCSLVELSASSVLLVCIGILMFFVSFAPIKQYEPLVIISKHFKMPKKEKVKDKGNGYQELVIQLIVGIAMLIIEYSIFVK